MSIVIVTGAGISAESGIRTFRDANGLWEDHRIEDVATPEAFRRQPEVVHRFYNQRRRQLTGGIQPNAAHYALAELEQKYRGDFLLVTQNVDNLHSRAGNTKLIHMHGELLKLECEGCGAIISHTDDADTSTRCRSCHTPLRPHIVWFGEMPLRMDDIMAALDQCEIFAAIGTSGNVYPAAGFVQAAYRAGAHTVEINVEPTTKASLFTEVRVGPATEQVPRWVADVLGR